MTEAELRDRLREFEPAEDPLAEERAWLAVRESLPASTAARRDRPPARRRLRLPMRVALPAVACLLIIAGGALAVRAPRQTLARWLRAAIGAAPTPHPRPLLAGLPGGGVLLVNSARGPWVVTGDGHRHFLGTYTGAAWSPHSLYVVAWRGDQLVALSPRGTLEWRHPADRTVEVARWSPDGYRIAYVSGHALSVIAGDGSGDHRIRGSVAVIAPAWEPGTATAHRLAVADSRGGVELLDADTGARLWRVGGGARPRGLWWTADGTRLVVLRRQALVVYDRRGRLLGSSPAPAGTTFAAVAVPRTGERAAAILDSRAAGQETVAVMTLTRPGLTRPPAVLLSASQRLGGLSWSPDGRWLLAASPSADEWIFIRATVPTRLEAVSRISGQFGGGESFPALAGWQPSAGG